MEDGLPGVDTAVANSIVAYRTQHGPFEFVEDLLSVSGVTVDLWQEFRPYACV